MQPSADAHTDKQGSASRRMRLFAIAAALVCVVIGVVAWQVVAAPVDVADYTVEVEDAAYTGDELEPLVKVSAGNKELVLGEDFTTTWHDNVNVGTASVTINGIGSYTGTNEGTFTIAPADMAAAEIQAGKTTYTGKAAHPTVQVQVNGRTLLQGADFELEYTDAVDAGTAELTVTGKATTPAARPASSRFPRSRSKTRRCPRLARRRSPAGLSSPRWR